MAEFFFITHHPPIRVGRKKRRGLTMKAAIQNAKINEIQVYVIKRKHSRYTPPTNQVGEEKEEESNDEISYSKHKLKETQVSKSTEKHSRYTTPTNQGWAEVFILHTTH